MSRSQALLLVACSRSWPAQLEHLHGLNLHTRTVRVVHRFWSFALQSNGARLPTRSISKLQTAIGFLPSHRTETVCTQYTNFATELSTHVWVFFRSKRRILTEILQCRAPPCCTLPFSLLWPIEHQVVPETMPGQESLDEPVIVLASAIDNSWSTVQLLLKSSRRSDPQFLAVERVH